MEPFEEASLLLLARQAPPVGALPPLPEYYRHPPFLNRHAPLLGFTITLMALSWICCLFRLYVRFFSKKRAPGWDDFFIILTMVGFLALPPRAIYLYHVSN